MKLHDVVVFEEEIDSVVLAHCQYSLAFGKGQEVTYNYSTLEKHIYNHFIAGKACIDKSTQPVMVYTSDIIRKDIFQQLQEKINPQVYNYRILPYDLFTVMLLIYVTVDCAVS